VRGNVNQKTNRGVKRMQRTAMISNGQLEILAQWLVNVLLRLINNSSSEHKEPGLNWHRF